MRLLGLSLPEYDSFTPLHTWTLGVQTMLILPVIVLGSFPHPGPLDPVMCQAQ